MLKIEYDFFIIITTMCVGLGCSPQPTSVQISGIPNEIYENSSFQLEVNILSEKNEQIKELESPVTFNILAGNAELAEQTLQVKGLEPIVIEARYGELTSKKTIKPKPSILGLYTRKSFPLKGMEVKITQSPDSSIIGTIETSPNSDSEAIEWELERKKSRFDKEGHKLYSKSKKFRKMLKAINDKHVKCAAEYFFKGSIKLKDIIYLGEGKWKINNLGIHGLRDNDSFNESNEVCETPNMKYTEGFLAFDSTKFTYKSFTGNDKKEGDLQDWIKVK
jgi:hypothetical protein